MGALRPLREALHPLPTPSPGAWGRERVYALVRGRLSTECALRRRRYALTVGQLRGVTRGREPVEAGVDVREGGGCAGWQGREGGGRGEAYLHPPGV